MSLIHNTAGDENTAERPGRTDFVEFRNRVKRLVESLVALRDLPSPDHPWRAEQERVEVTLESQAVIVKFFVAQLTWEIGSTLVHDFQRTFGKFAPVFLDSSNSAGFRLGKAREQSGSFGRVYLQDDTTLDVRQSVFQTAASIGIQTPLNDFNDHFEVFTSDAARMLFPPIEKPRKKTADLECWFKEFGRSFEQAGCRVVRESALRWKDLTGLVNLRERLERSVFLPLAREQLYQKIAQRVAPHRMNVLPRGVLLYGPPGCGKTWSMKVIAGEARLPVVVLPCNAVLTKWYGESENRLAGVFGLCREAGRMIMLIDELDALARHRGESDATTARLVSILLAEMDGLAESSQVLLVGSVNTVEALDEAVRDRFDVKIAFGLPNSDQLHAALSYHASQLSHDDVAELIERMEGWNFRQVARFAEEALRFYVSRLDLTLLEADEPPVPRKEDYLAALANFQ